jgi:NhaP-type Na+/H+ or K+/H+ antiporter
MVQDEKHFDSMTEILVLWAGVLLPPIVWAIQMEINYALVRRACSTERNLALYAVTIMALALTLVSTLISWSTWRKSGMGWPSEAADARTRKSFLSVLGLLSSAMFFLVILAQGIATVFFHPCQP